MSRRSFAGLVMAFAVSLVVGEVFARGGSKLPVASFHVDTKATEDGWQYYNFSVTDKDLMVLRYKDGDGQLTNKGLFS